LHFICLHVLYAAQADLGAVWASTEESHSYHWQNNTNYKGLQVKNNQIVTLGEEMRDWQKASEKAGFLSQQTVGSEVIIVLDDVIRNPQ